MDRQAAKRLLALPFALIAVGLIGWSAWFYHYAPEAHSTDETAGTWIAIGSLTLLGGLLSLGIAVRLLRGSRS
jgi:hypothetical protein